MSPRKMLVAASIPRLSGFPAQKNFELLQP